jgi:hypothetical protein
MLFVKCCDIIAIKAPSEDNTSMWGVSVLHVNSLINLLLNDINLILFKKFQLIFLVFLSLLDITFKFLYACFVPNDCV